MLNTHCTIDDICQVWDATRKEVCDELRERNVDPNAFVWLTNRLLADELEDQARGYADHTTSLKDMASEALDMLEANGAGGSMMAEFEDSDGQTCPQCGAHVADQMTYTSGYRHGRVRHEFSCAECGTRWFSTMEPSKTVTVTGDAVPERQPKDVAEAVSRMMRWATDDAFVRGDDTPRLTCDVILDGLGFFAKEILRASEKTSDRRPETSTKPQTP